ncbi:MAG: flagellar basal body P-ring formation protein FlgA [Planctomycetes bacterium]|nr:flagellar basal body P-ring formation protein FlgA [Planctomycetota bacterium]
MKQLHNILARCVVLLTALVIGAAVVTPADAAELVLRGSIKTTDVLVHLGDVADIYTDDAQLLHALRGVELFPAPQPGAKRQLRIRELQDLLVQRGVNMLEHRLAGASQIEIINATVDEASQAVAPPNPAQLRRANDAVRAAVAGYLNGRAGHEEQWNLELNLTGDQGNVVLAANTQVQISGGKAPWLGAQKMTVAPRSPNASTFEIEVRVSLPPAVVMLNKALPRGGVIRSGDVTLERGVKFDSKGAAPFTRLEDVIGMETTQVLAAGQYLDADDVRAPIVIRRGDVVTVYVRSAGLLVRTTGRAREDASQGDLISIESLLNRQTFFARCTGIQEVEVFAHAAGGGMAPAGAVAAAQGEGGSR